LTGILSQSRSSSGFLIPHWNPEVFIKAEKFDRHLESMQILIWIPHTSFESTRFMTKVENFERYLASMQILIWIPYTSFESRTYHDQSRKI